MITKAHENQTTLSFFIVIQLWLITWTYYNGHNQLFGSIATRMSFEKFRILLWKNWTIQKRHWKSGIFEVIFPVLLIVLFTWVRHEAIKDDSTTESTVVSFDQTDYELSLCTLSGQNITNIYYSPTSEWLEFLVRKTFSSDDIIKIESFPNSRELDQFLDKNRTTNEPIFGIEFEDALQVSFKTVHNIILGVVKAIS